MRLPSVLFAVLLAGLAIPAAALQLEGLAPELNAALAREAKPLGAKPFKTKAGVTGNVEAKSAPKVVDEEKSSDLEVDLGTEAALNCTVQPLRSDASTLVSAMIGALSKSAGIQIAQSAVVGIDESAGRPIVVTESVYLAARPDGTKVLGHLKVLVSPGDAVTFFCFHDELGYSATVRRVVKALAASLSRPGAEDGLSAATFAELQVMKIGDVTLGFEERRTVQGPKGSALESYASLLVPGKKPGEFGAEESYRTEVADKDGFVVEGAFAKNVGGETVRRLELKRGGDGGYTVEGVIDGKPAKGVFSPAGGLVSDLLISSRVVAAKAPAGTKGPQWLPENDPIGATEVVLSADPKRPGRYDVQAGKVRISSELDKAGVGKRAEVDVGGATLTVARVWSKGKVTPIQPR